MTTTDNPTTTTSVYRLEWRSSDNGWIRETGHRNTFDETWDWLQAERREFTSIRYRIVRVTTTTISETCYSDE